MANAPMGFDFIQGSLGVVLLTYNNIDLGKTIDEATIEFIEDVKDIMFAQNGTQPYDKVPTGQAYQITCKIGEITWQRLRQVMRGITVSGDGHSVLLGRDVYRSGRDNFAHQLVITRVDSDGIRSTDPYYRLTFFQAMAMVNGAIGAFGPDTQREVEVQWYAFYDEGQGGFGYQGIASSVGL